MAQWVNVPAELILIPRVQKVEGGVDWRDGLVVKSTYCSYKRTHIQFPYPHWVAPVPRDPTPSSGSEGICTHVLKTHTLRYRQIHL